MKIIQRYVIHESSRALLLSVSVLTFFLVIAQFIKVADLVFNKGISSIVGIQWLMYTIPYLLSYTIPMSMLVATLLVFGRLAADNEISAFGASGVSPMQLGVPLIVLSLLLSCLLVLMNDLVVPRAHYAKRRIEKQIPIQHPTAFLEPGVVIDAFDGYKLLVHGIDGPNLRKIRIIQPNPDGPTRTIIAERGQLIPLADGRGIQLRLFNGTSDEPNPRNPSSFYKLNFKSYTIQLHLEHSLLPQELGKKPKDMTIQELLQETAARTAIGMDTQKLVVEFHRKWAVAFAGLVFVVIGIPTALLFRQRGALLAFGLSFVVFVGYYLLHAGGFAVAHEGWVSPAIGLWTPNIVGISIGSVLYWRCVHT